MYKIIFAFLLSFILVNNVEAQFYPERKLKISPKEIKIIDGYQWDVDTPLVENLLDNYFLFLTKDTSKVEIRGITLNMSEPGTKNILNLDSLNRPTHLSYKKDYDELKYSYEFFWDDNGKLKKIIEYRFGKPYVLYPKVLIIDKKKRRKK
jgi:hypothetical protein